MATIHQMPDKIGVKVTTDATIMRDLKASLHQHPHYAGDTVGEFIDALLQLTGVNRDTLLGSIEFGIAQASTGRLRVEFDENGAAEIREVYNHAG